MLLVTAAVRAAKHVWTGRCPDILSPSPPGFVNQVQGLCAMATLHPPSGARDRCAAD